MDLDRTQFPKHTQLQGLSAQAATWLLRQIERSDLTIYEALFIVNHLQTTVISLMQRQEDEDS